jgi:hypothetical protein
MAKVKEKERDAGPRARNDAYVMMLVITFVSILVGCVLMYLDFAGTKGLGIGEDPGYGERQAPKENISPPPRLGDSAPAGGAAGGAGGAGGAGVGTPMGGM